MVHREDYQRRVRQRSWNNVNALNHLFDLAKADYPGKCLSNDQRGSIQGHVDQCTTKQL